MPGRPVRRQTGYDAGSIPAKEAVMAEPRKRQAEAAADPGPEVRPEVIQDLDVTGDHADGIVGGTNPRTIGPTRPQ
jgi:hypothetical protein